MPTDGSVESSCGGAVVVGMEIRFSDKVYSQRNCKSQYVLIATSTSGNVSNGGVESSCGGAVTEAADPRKKKPSIFPQVGSTPILKRPNIKDPKKGQSLCI